MLKDYFSLAFGNIKHRGLRSWLTMLGIFIGIAAVVSLISMGQGLEAAVTGQFGTLSVDKLTIQNKQTGFAPPGSAVVEKLNEHDLNVVKSVSGIELVVPRWIRVTSIEYNKVSTFVYVADLPADKEGIKLVYDSFQPEVSQGKLLGVGDTGKVILGSNFADPNTFDKEIRAGDKILINGKGFDVAGILKPTSTITINGAILIPHNDMKTLLNIGDEYDLIIVKVKDKNKIQEVSDDISNKLRKDRHEKVGEESFSVQTPLQALSSVTTVLNIINLIVIGIATISLFVGGVGIANTMYTSVVERTKEIGIMKAIGAKNKDVLMIFLIESGLLGLVGGVAGALIGLGGALVISIVANQFLGEGLFRISVNFALLFGAVSFSFLVGVLSGIFPAIQASKLRVVDALRG